VLARRQHLVGQDDHAIVSRVHDADRPDITERFAGDRLLALDLRCNVAGGHVRHALGGAGSVAGFRVRERAFGFASAGPPEVASGLDEGPAAC
jgi:hypothetical protein